MLKQAVRPAGRISEQSWPLRQAFGVQGHRQGAMSQPCLWSQGFGTYGWSCTRSSELLFTYACMSTSCASDGRGGGVAFGISGVASTCLAHSGWNHLGLCLDWASVDRSTFIVYYYGSQKAKKQLDYGRAQTKIQNTSIHVQVSRVPRLTQRIRLVLGGLVSHNLDVQINSLNKRRLEL